MRGPLSYRKSDGNPNLRLAHDISIFYFLNIINKIINKMLIKKTVYL